MIDVVNRHTRSRMMSTIRREDTAPELAVRRYLHRAGLRYRLHDRQLPGTPDIVFSRTRTAVFVHGCFWHRHAGCRFAANPATRAAFWAAKFETNKARDRASTAALKALGWTVLIIWECEARDELALDRLVWAIRASQPSVK